MYLHVQNTYHLLTMGFFNLLFSKLGTRSSINYQLGRKLYVVSGTGGPVRSTRRLAFFAPPQHTQRKRNYVLYICIVLYCTVLTHTLRGFFWVNGPRRVCKVNRTVQNIKVILTLCWPFYIHRRNQPGRRTCIYVEYVCTYVTMLCRRWGAEPFCQTPFLSEPRWLCVNDID